MSAYNQEDGSGKPLADAGRPEGWGGHGAVRFTKWADEWDLSPREKEVAWNAWCEAVSPPEAKPAEAPEAEPSHDENCFLAMGGGGECNCSLRYGPALVEDGKRKAGPEWTCVGCGNADPAKYRTIEHVIIGEPTDYDIECDECGSREFEESMENALLRVIEQRDDAAGKAASLESMRKALGDLCERVERGRKLVQEMCDRQPGGPWKPENNNWGIFDTSAARAALAEAGEGGRG